MKEIHTVADISNPISELFDDHDITDERTRNDEHTCKNERDREARRDEKARRNANLSLRRWDAEKDGVRNLDKAEERELIRLAQAEAKERRPLYRAGDKLVIHHHKSVLTIANDYFGPEPENSYRCGALGSKEDRVAAGLLWWWEAVVRNGHNRPNGLNAHARYWIDKGIREECRIARKRGDSSDTRADRKVYDNRPRKTGAKTAQQIAALTTRLLCSNEQWAAGVKSAQEAIDRARVYWHGHDEYQEGYADESYGSDGERYSSGSLKYSTRHDFMRLYDYFKYGQPTAEMKCHSRVVDEFFVKLDRRAERWLRAMGRRAYALWLSRRDRKPIPKPEIPMADYTVSINTAATASDSSDWKSDLDKLAPTALSLVFDEKDRWGWYMSRKGPKNDDQHERIDNDGIRQVTRHQTSRLRSGRRDRGSDTRSRPSGHDQHERRHAEGFSDRTQAARLS